MADEKSGKGFTVVDRRVSGNGEPSGPAAGGGAEKPARAGAEGAAPESARPGKQGAEAAGSPAGKGAPPEWTPIKVTFPTFLLSLHTSALIHLGIIPDPVSNQRSVELEMGRQNIELVEMLKEKTAGNLTEDEGRLLDNILYELRMAYIQVSETQPKKEEKK